MNKLSLISLFLIAIIGASGQEVKRMKINELEEYIASRQHPVIVNFWATWCAPCLEEMPAFNKVTPAYKKDNLELVFVSLDSRNAFPSRIVSMANRLKINGTLIWLDETDANMFCPRIDNRWGGSIPATLFVNNQKQRRKFLEEQLNTSKLRKEIRSIL